MNSKNIYHFLIKVSYPSIKLIPINNDEIADKENTISISLENIERDMTFFVSKKISDRVISSEKITINYTFKNDPKDLVKFINDKIVFFRTHIFNKDSKNLSKELIKTVYKFVNRLIKIMIEKDLRLNKDILNLQLEKIGIPITVKKFTV